jgi:hypothetical protein
MEKKTNLAEQIEQAIERERERRRVFINGFFYGAAVVLWVLQIVRAFSKRED